MQDILKNLSYLLPIVAGIFAFIKWVDSRNKQLKNDRYDKYIKLVKIISGSKENRDASICFTEQIASTWLLLDFKEYYHLTIKIFDNDLLEQYSDKNWSSVIIPDKKSRSRNQK